MSITINGTTGISGVDGSAGTPALQGSDPNTGIYSPGADQVAVATNGQGRLFISSTGQIGIGGAPSGGNLNIIDPVPTIRLTDSDTNGYSHVLQSDTSLYLDADRGAAGTGALIVRTNGTNERLRITSDAYVRLASGTGGIQFNGDTAAANALDDYEEGTWTVATVGISGTITANAGHYVKVGKMVTCWWDIYSSSNNLAWSGGHAAYLSGFPFAAVANIVGSGSVVRIDNAINSFQVDHYFEGSTTASTLKLETGASSQRHLSGIISFITNA